MVAPDGNSTHRSSKPLVLPSLSALSADWLGSNLLLSLSREGFEYKHPEAVHESAQQG
jgi:hypothetical protein